MAATIEQPSQETPQKEEAKQAPITLKNISEERIGREAWGENQLKEKSYDRIMRTKETPHAIDHELHERCGELLGKCVVTDCVPLAL